QLPLPPTPTIFPYTTLFRSPTAPGTDHLAVLIEEHIVMDDEQALFLDELVERPRLQRNGIARPRRHVVAPGLAGIYGAGAAHPVVDRDTGEHQQNVDRGRRDQPAVA